MKRIGIIDIGSNSVRLVIAEVIEDKSYHIIDELKEAVRIGQDMGDSNKLRPERIEMAIQTLKTFKKLCEAMQVTEIIAAATEAIRKASNREEFIGRARDEAGINIRILSGEEEGYYDFIGVISSMDIKDCLIMDIGGCSTEIIKVKNRSIEAVTSLPIGSINLASRFNLQDRINTEDMKAMKNFLTENFSKVPWLSGNDNGILIGVGGTIRNISKIDKKRRNYSLDTTHNYHMKAQSVHEIFDMVRTKNLIQREKIKGLSKDRADIFVGAAGAVSALVEYCGISDVYVSGYGLREGLIFEYLLGKNNIIGDVLDFSISSMINRHGLNEAHSRKVWELAASLYRQIEGRDSDDDEIHKILKTAAMLHDCGVGISYYDHHKHTFYMLLNSNINGLTHKQLLISAYIAALHRKDDFKLQALEHADILDESDILFIQKAGLLLRLAESLDRGMNGIISSLLCDVKKDDIIIRLISESKPVLEISDALGASGQFKKMYKKNLYIING